MGIQLPSLDGASLVPVLRVKSLEVILDASLLMDNHISSVARSAFYHLFVLIKHFTDFFLLKDKTNLKNKQQPECQIVNENL